MVKFIAEKSPNAFRDFTFARKSCCSGTENAEQHSAHQRENGSVRADAERQCQNHGDRQPWSPN